MSFKEKKIVLSLRHVCMVFTERAHGTNHFKTTNERENLKTTDMTPVAQTRRARVSLFTRLEFPLTGRLFYEGQR